VGLLTPRPSPPQIAPTRLRGALGSVNQLLICVGILAALLVNVALPAAAWRAMFALSAAPAALLGAGMLFSPESPAWLVLAGRRAEAEDTALRLWGPQGLAQLGTGALRVRGVVWGGVCVVCAQCLGIVSVRACLCALRGIFVARSPTPRLAPWLPLFADKDGGGAPAADPSWREVLANRGALTGVAIFVLQQFSGINAIVYFSSSVFSAAGVASGALASAAVGAVNVAGTVAAAGMMDRAGRKQLLGVSFAGMGVSMLAMALGLALPGLKGVSGPVALCGTLAYILSFALGAGPVPGLLVPEITPAKIRGRAVALAMGAHWVCNFAVGQAFLAAVGRVGVAGVYTFFAAVCFAAVAFVSRAVVETSGRSLEDIERAMGA
jgi:hypothetical protein